MSNLPDKCCFKTNQLNKSMQFNTRKQSTLFSDKNTTFERSFVVNKTNPTTFSGMLPRKSCVSSQINQFKIPSIDSLPVKKATVKSINSPPRRVQAGRVKNDLKSSQQSKLSLIPRPSFINSRKSLHGSRRIQLNARKELIKKMVFLAECTLKENNEIKQSTPKKVLAGLTPKKTPRSGGYFMLPEFKKNLPKVEDIRSPIQDFIKKEMFPHSGKPTPLIEKRGPKVEDIRSPIQDFIKKGMLVNSAKATPLFENKVSPMKLNEEQSFKLSPKEETVEVRNNKSFTEILSHCKTYNEEVRVIHENIRHLDNTFEKKLKDLPDYRVYNEFCIYQIKKEELYKELQLLEVDLREFISSHTKVGNKLNAYVKRKQEVFEKQLNLHKDFEQAVNSILGKCENENKENILKERKPKGETPKLRRSLRLSKIKKSKFEERTPMTKKLKKLDTKSKGIQRCGKL